MAKQRRVPLMASLGAFAATRGMQRLHGMGGLRWFDDAAWPDICGWDYPRNRADETPVRAQVRQRVTGLTTSRLVTVPR